MIVKQIIIIIMVNYSFLIWQRQTKFLKIQEAYEYLEKIWILNENEIEIDIDNTEECNEYTKVLQSFIQILTKNEKINEPL